MRDLTIQELAQINGGYYVQAMVDGAKAGAYWASLIAVGSLGAGGVAGAYNPLKAIGTGAAIGAAFGLAGKASVDLDSMIVNAANNTAVVEIPAVEATVTTA